MTKKIQPHGEKGEAPGMCVHVDRKVTSVVKPHTENEKQIKNTNNESAPVLRKIR